MDALISLILTDAFDSTIINKLYHIIEEKAECEIWGDGSARREFMYAGDFSDAIICIR